MASVNEISVPVRLKVMQDSIASFQKILDNLQPKTNSWKALSKLLNTMVSDSQKLQAQMSTPFNSQKDFNQTERTISKLEESAARFSFAVKQIQFSDLKLDQSQIEELQKYEQEIENIRNAYKKLQEDTKEKLLSNETNSNLIGNISASTLTKDFDAIEKSVDTHIKGLNSKVEEYKKNLSQFQNNIQLGDQAAALTTSGLSKTSLGATIFDKYLSETSKGLQIKSWNSGVTKQALLTEIEQMFNLTPGELQPLAQKTINQINQAFQDMSKRGQLNVFDKIINRGNTAKKSTPIANDELTTLQNQLQEYRTLYAEIQRLKESSGINNFNTNNQSAITEAEQKLQKLQNTILQGITANEQYKNSASALANEFPRVRSALGEVNAEFLRQQSVMNSFNSMKTTVANFMGFYQVLNLTKRAIKDAANHIKDLDSVMNKISIVTDMDTSDLWGQIDQYSKMAQTYGTTIKGAYEVSQIYYQQGLDTADVLTLTNETLKLAKVSGLDYASTTDYMTTALRGFKMEMSDAAAVVDVYSNLAANTAVSQEELAVAMSKTASSMESVGSSFEETSAMIATMVAVTRESATNIGSALKSIAARYGEMKSDPLAMTDSEGEELVYNKVDAALQSVGITLKDTEGQFRNFTEVITELAEKWDQLESTQQRYIATQFAGNRQQSRFLALVSNKDLLAENIAVAENSEDTGTVQALKALDSLESKIEQVRVAYQQFYTTIGIEDVWKGFLDNAKNIVNTLNGMPKLFGKLPIGALNAIAQVVNILKTFAFQGLQQTAFLMGKGFKAGMDSAKGEMTNAANTAIQQVESSIAGHESTFSTLGKKLGTALSVGLKNGDPTGLYTTAGQKYNNTNQMADWKSRAEYLDSVRARGETVPGQLQRGYHSLAEEMKSAGLITQQAYDIINSGGARASYVVSLLGTTADEVNLKFLKLGTGINTFGQALNMMSLMINTTNRSGKVLSGTLQTIAGVAMVAGAIVKSAGEIAASGWNAIPFIAIASGIIAVINGISQIIQATSIEAELEEVTAKAEELTNKSKELKSAYRTLDTGIKKYKELEKTRYDSTESAEEYQTAVDDLANAYPQLIESYNLNGEAVLNANAMERALTDARNASAEAALRAAEAEITRSEKENEQKKSDIEKATTELSRSNASETGDTESSVWNAMWSAIAGLSPEDTAVRSYLKTMESQSRNSNFDQVLQTYDELQHYLHENGLKLNKSAQNIVDTLITSIQEYEGNVDNIANANLAMVSATLNSTYGTNESSILRENSGLLNLANQGLYDYIVESKNSDFTQIGITEAAQELFGNLEEVWGNLTDNEINDLNTILNNPSSFSSADLIEKAAQYDIEIDEWMLKLFEKKSDENKAMLENKSKQVKDKGIDTTAIDNIINDENNFITLDERKLLTHGLNQAASLRKNGYNEQNFLSEFATLYQNVAQLPAEARNQLIEQLLNNGFTKEGLIQTKQYIEQQNIDLDMTPLLNLIDQIIPNVQLTIDSIMDSLNSELDNFESVTSSLQSGVKAPKLQKTIDTAKSLGIELERSDFIVDGDKFIINYEKYKEVLQQLKNKYQEQLDVSVEEIEQAQTRLENNVNDTDAAHLIFGGDFEKYYEKGDDGIYSLKSQYNNADFQNTILDAKNKAVDAINNYNQYLNDLFTSWSKTLDWQHGDYSSLSTLGLDTFTSGAEIDRIQELIRNPESLTEAEAAQPEVLNAVKQYQDGWDTVLTDLTTYGIDYLESHAALYKGIGEQEIQSLADSIQSEAGETLPEAIARVATLAGKTIDKINSTVLDWVMKNSNFGKENALSKLMSGFTLESLEKFISTSADDKDINSYINEDGSLKGSLADVYEWDEVSNSFQAKSGTYITAIFEAWRNATGRSIEEGSDLYYQVLKDWTDSQIKEAEKHDKFTQGIATLTSAKAGQRINLQGIDSRINQALQDSGVKVVQGYTENITQAQINAAIIAAAKAAETDPDLDEWERLAAQEAAEKVQTSINQYDALAGVISDTVSSSEAKTWAAANGMDDARAAMAQIGYEWDDNLGVYVSTADSIIALEESIASLESADNNDATQQKIAELKAKLADLKYASSDSGRKYQAVSTVISDAENVNNEALEQLKNAFSEETLNWTDSDWNQYITSNNDGTSSINIIEFLKQVGYNIDNLFSQTIAQKAQGYISALSNTQLLVSQGTTDYTEIEKFNEEINKLVEDQYLEGGIVGEAFNYDDLTKTYKLTSEAWQTYVKGETERLKALNYNSEEIKSILTKQAAENIDFDTFLNTGGQIARSNLKDQLQMWLTTKYGQAANEATLNFYISSFEEGGEAAIAAAKEIAADEGKELTAEEIEAVYRAQVAPLVAISEKLSELQVGSVVAANQIAALNAAGFTVDENGVVTAVGDMIQAYKSIYAQMKATGEATTAELNAALGTYLDNRDGEQQAIDALSNATNMTYSEFAEIFTNAGKELTEEMVNQYQASGMIKHLGGNKMMIADFDAFASEMGWSPDSEEYTSAFKSYNDNLIEYNKQIGANIKAEFDAISEAKTGDQINLTETINKVDETAREEFTQQLADYGAILNNGILTLTSEANIPAIAAMVGSVAVSAGGMIKNEYDAAMARLYTQNQSSVDTAFSSILSSYDSISIDLIESLAQSLKVDFASLIGPKGIFTDADNNGTYKLDTSQILSYVAWAKENVSDEVYNQLLNTVASLQDEALSSISTAANYNYNGISSIADMQAFVDKYNQLVDENSQIDIESAFEYDTINNTFKLNNAVLQSYIEQQKAVLKQLGLSGEAIDEYIKDQTDTILRESIELDNFLTASTSKERNDEANKLIQQIRGLSNYKDLFTQDSSLIQKLKDHHFDQESFSRDWEQYQEQYDLLILETLESGGQDAVDLLKQIKPDASPEELEAAFNSQINKLNDAMNQVGDLVAGQFIGTEGKLYEILSDIHAVDDNGVIVEGFRMVEAYARIYAEMKETATSTTADLNNAYVQLLTAQDQESVDLIEALNNASGMTYEAIGQIFTRYGIELEQALLNSEDAGIARVGYNKIAITDFAKFKGYIEQAIGHTIEVGTQEYLDAYSAYVDSQINMRNQGKNNLQTAFDQLKSVTEAKVGDLLNVTYLEDAFDKSTKTDKDTLVQIAEKFGASIKDGILTISKYTDVPGLLQAVAEEAGRAGLLIPEQLAELTDAIADMLSNITSLISNGITGTLNNTDALSLQNWAEKQGLQPLEFNETVEGLQLTADSIAMVYAEMKRLNSLQAQSLLSTIIESNDRYSTLASTLQAAAEVTQRIDFTRATITNPRRTVMGDVGANGVALITPVLPDGTELGDDWAKTLATKYANGEINLTTKLQGSDGQELSYTLEDVSRGLYTAENAVQQATSAMQSYNAAAESAAGATEDFTASLDNLAAQSSLMSDIVLNKLTDPDAMNFMSDKLPDNYQVAINAWENASKAINTLTTAGKNGYIGVEDFYNIVNTSAGLLEAAGKEFNIKGMNAADLMEAACQHLKVVDGDLKIDLSSAGLDMVSGVDDLKNNLTDGIHELAAAEVAILDAEIQVLEVLAAMEAMGDMVVDVDNNGISFELNDMFTFDVDGNVEGFTEDMQAFLDQMNEAIATSDDLEKAVKAIQINGTTLYDLFQGTAKDWEKTFGSAEGASKFMQKLSNIDWGTDINTIQTQIVNAMKDLGQNLVIDVGDNGLVGITATGQLFNIDLDDKDVAKQAQQAVNAFRTDHPDFFEGTNLRDNVKQLINELNNPDSNYVQADLQYTLKVITGEIKIEEEKNDKGQKTGKFVGEYAGVKFRADSIGDVEKYIKQAIDLENQGLSKIEFNEETGEVSGTLNVGAARIKVTKNGDKTTIETDEIDGERYNGDTVEGAVKWLAERGYADNKLAGKTWSIDGTFYEVIQDNELGITYTFTRGSDKKNSWLYNGQTFTSYDEMAQYIRDIVPLEQGLSDDWHQKAGTQHNKAGQEVKIWTNGTATIEYNLETGKVTILADGITFKSRAEADEYLAEKAMADQQADGKDHGVFEDGDTTTLKYTSNGNEYEVEYNSTGKVKTKVTMADTGYTFEATSDTELAMGLAAAAAIAKQKAGELPDLDSNQGTVTIHANGDNYEVTIDDTGKVTVKDPQGKIDEALSEELTKKLEQSKIDTNLKNTISTAITEAFTSLKSELENLDTESITTLATALSTVSSAIDTLAKNKGIETFGKSIEDLKTDNFIAVTTAMDNMAKSLQTLATAADWVTLGIALALLNAALVLVNINSTAFDALKEKVDALANDENFTTLQNKLQDIVDKLLKIKQNKDIDIKISFDDGGALSKLQQLAELIDRLTGKDVNVNVNTSGDNPPSNGLTDPRKSNLPDPSKYNLPNPSAESTPQGTLPSFANGDGPINPNLESEIVKIQTEFDQPTNSVDPPANPVEVPVEYNTENTPEPETPDPVEQEVTYKNNEIPEAEVPDAEGEVNWKNGETPETPTIPDAEGKVNWVNGSTPTPPSFTATGVIHWQSAAAGNFIFHKYLKRDKPAVDKPGAKNRQETVKATGNAFAGGTPTLMGELGPELVVSKGRYGLVGLDGPEFISLDKDAIVFNHLQTESLMTKGMSRERGRAVTNERNAVAFATGNINGGPAMASASAALAVLKQLRAMWESLQNASVSDLAGAAGGGGGGGGGSEDDTSTPAEWVALVERWYNLTQEIAKLEKEITHEEELRSKLQGDFSKNGKAYYQSQKRSLQALKDQIQAQEQLNLSRENYFDQRRAALEKTPLGNIYEFDEKGQMKFKDNLNPNKFNGHTNSFDFLQDLYGYDKNGKANYTNKQKYEIMQKAGLGEYMLYDSNGTKINKDDFDDEDEYYKTVTQQVKDRIDDYASATQSLWDEIQTGKDDLLKLQQAENEILQEMRDNQMEVEDKVLDAIEDMKQREIDALQDERDKLEESVGKYIDGLSNALDNEQKMYDTQDSQNELDTKKRRLGILQRSGASAADVSALQSEILQSEKDMYFNAQQAQIDAIQEASDLEIARLDSQIAIMQETLDYQKEFGLLWYQVYDVMQGSAEQITTFIMGQNSSFWAQSPLKNATDANDILFQATQWQEYREDIASANDSLVTIATASQREIQEKDYKIFDEAMKKEFGNDYDKKGKYKDLFNEEYANGEHAGDITEVSATVRATYTHDAALAKRKKEAGQYWTHTGPDRYISINDTQHWHYKYKKETIEGVTGYYFTSKTKEDHEWKNEKCSKCGHKKPAPQSSGGGWSGGGSSSSGCGSCSAKCGGNCTDFCQSSCWDSCGASCKSGCGSKNTSGRGKASGGYVTHGTYELGELGTETVLNAQQTRVLRNNILSNRPSSLISLLKTYNEGFSRMGNPLVGTPTTEDNSTNIETVELNMNVQQIANDYDARRAGEQALSEIMRIAKKTSAANSIRR